MKNNFSSHLQLTGPSSNRLPWLAATALLLTAVSEVHASAADEARASEVRQQQILADSQGIVVRLDATIEEYENNGLVGDDLEALTALREVLGRVSQAEMEKIVDLLGRASDDQSPLSAIKTIGNAYTAQKGVLMELKTVLAAYDREQEATVLARRLSDLADRQATNLQAGIVVAAWKKPKKGEDDPSSASLEAQTSEQKAIAGELELLRDRMRTFVADPVDQKVAARFNQALAEMEKIVPSADRAAAALEEDQLDAAIGIEKQARDAMRRLARTLAPGDDAEALAAAREQLQRMVEEQEDIVAATVEALPQTKEDFLQEALSDPNSPAAKRLEARKANGKNLAQLLQDKKADQAYQDMTRRTKKALAVVEDRQDDMAARSDTLGQELEQTAPAASQALQGALAATQKAQEQMTDGQVPAALTSQQATLAELRRAEAAVGRQADLLAGAADDAAVDPLMQATALREQTQEMMREQSTAMKPGQDPAAVAAQERALATQAAAAAQAAQPTMAPAAAALDQAAGRMQQAAQADTPTARVQAQQQALAALATADAHLAQSEAALAEAQKNLAAVEEVLQQLNSIVDAQQQLQSDTAMLAPALEPDMVQAKSLAASQSALLEKVAALSGDTAAASAKPALIAALTPMQSAASQLGQTNVGAADPLQREALEQLRSAQTGLQAQQAAALAALGMEPASSAAMAAAQLAEAQAKTGEAVAALVQEAAAASESSAPSSAAPAAPALASAAQASSQAAAAAGGLPTSAQSAIREATQMLAAATAQSAAGQPAAAQASAKGAQAALAQAQAAAAQAQAGVSLAGPPSGDSAPDRAPGAAGPPAHPDRSAAAGYARGASILRRRPQAAWPLAANTLACRHGTVPPSSSPEPPLIRRSIPGASSNTCRTCPMKASLLKSLSVLLCSTSLPLAPPARAKTPQVLSSRSARRPSAQSTGGLSSWLASKISTAPGRSSLGNPATRSP